MDLDAPVWRYCPDFPEKPWPVTARGPALPPGRDPALPAGRADTRPAAPRVLRRRRSSVFRDDLPLRARAGDGGALARPSATTLLGCAAAGAGPAAPCLEPAPPKPSSVLPGWRRPGPTTCAGSRRIGAGIVRGRGGPPPELGARGHELDKVPGGGLSGHRGRRGPLRLGPRLWAGSLSPAPRSRQMLTRQRTRDGRVTGYGLGLHARRARRPLRGLAHRRAGAREHRAVPVSGRRRPGRRTLGGDPLQPGGSPSPELLALARVAAVNRHF